MNYAYTKLDQRLNAEFAGIDRTLAQLCKHPDPTSKEYRQAIGAVIQRALTLRDLLRGLRGQLVSPDGHLLDQKSVRIRERESDGRVRRAKRMRIDPALGTLESCFSRPIANDPTDS